MSIIYFSLFCLLFVNISAVGYPCRLCREEDIPMICTPQTGESYCFCEPDAAALLQCDLILDDNAPPISNISLRILSEWCNFCEGIEFDAWAISLLHPFFCASGRRRHDSLFPLMTSYGTAFSKRQHQPK